MLLINELVKFSNNRAFSFLFFAYPNGVFMNYLLKPRELILYFSNLFKLRVVLALLLRKCLVDFY
jgi:hypothetical protein